MKVALIGATGNIGTRILNEALSRGHGVTGISRHADKIADKKNLTKKTADVLKADEAAKLLAGHDAVIASYNAPPDEFVKGGAAIIAAVKKAGVKRLLFVGGAGTMDAKPGLALVDTPEFPAVIKPVASAMRDLYRLLLKEQDLEWTFLAPAVMIEAGTRTGKFRTNVDLVLSAAGGGPSRISYEDYAVAMIDELEKKQHVRQRLTLGY